MGLRFLATFMLLLAFGTKVGSASPDLLCAAPRCSQDARLLRHTNPEAAFIPQLADANVVQKIFGQDPEKNARRRERIGNFIWGAAAVVSLLAVRY